MGVMSPKQKEFYADKAVDLAHLIAAVLVIGQFLAEKFDPGLFAVGFVIFIGLYIISYFLTKEE